MVPNMKKYKGSDHDQQSLLSKIYCYLQQSQNIPMIPIHTMHEWSFCSTIIYNIYFWQQGMEGFENQINRLMDLTAYQVKKMKEQPEKFYFLFDTPECTNVCFW